MSESFDLFVVFVAADGTTLAYGFPEERMTQKSRAGAESRQRARGPVAESIAAGVTEWVGSSKGMTAAVPVVVVWAASGPLFGWSTRGSW